VNIAASNAATLQKARRNVIAVMRIVVRYPQGANAEEANADFRNGVLEITMPATQRAEDSHRQIEIKGETGAKSNHEPGQRPPAKNN